VSSPHTLSLVGEDYIISAQPDKPLLNVWQVRRNYSRYYIAVKFI
jgi:hypothetical protein